MTEVDDEIDAVKAVYLDDVVSEGSRKDGSRWLKVRYIVLSGFGPRML